MAGADLSVFLEPHTPTVREVFVALRVLVNEDQASGGDPPERA